MNKNTITYHIIKEILALSHFYESTISDCVEHYLFKNQFSLPSDQKNEIIQNIKSALIILKNERIL